jgi:hypothetical protein
MQANITLKLDAELIREARVIAAREGTSVSQLMADLLEERIRRDRAYEKARRRAVSRLKQGYDLQWSPPASRDELYER